MTPFLRRFFLGLGAFLLVGGWGTTRFAAQHDQNWYRYLGSKAYRSPAEVVWDRSLGDVYIIGVVGMAIGAGFIGFAFLRPGEKPEE